MVVSCRMLKLSWVLSCLTSVVCSCPWNALKVNWLSRRDWVNHFSWFAISFSSIFHA